jgi:hypothetical protein
MAIDTTSHVEASCTTQLLDAAGPVVARLGDGLRGTDVTVVVSDSAGRVVARGAPNPDEFDSGPLRVGSVLPTYLNELPHVSIATAPIMDAHLRHIFRKLDINSRVELASVVATRTAERATR